MKGTVTELSPTSTPPELHHQMETLEQATIDAAAAAGHQSMRLTRFDLHAPENVVEKMKMKCNKL